MHGKGLYRASGCGVSRRSLACRTGADRAGRPDIIMRSAFAACLAASLLASPAAEADSMDVAAQLGSVLAGEEFCGLTYDQAAIQAFIEKHVKSDDMSFPSMLQTMTSGYEIENKDLSASGKTAHCVQIARIARSYGFTK